MENFLIYIGKSAIAAGAFYIVFLLLFQNQKQFVFNRIYLPVSLALSFIIPLITFTTVKYIEPTAATNFSRFAYLAESTGYQPSPFEWEWYHYLFGIYLLGIAGFLFHLLLGHLKAISIIQKSRIQRLFESLVNITKKDVHPFSFFNKIVLSEKTLSHPNLDIIVSHENIHVKEKHSLDILFTEILFMGQWFNPFAWLIKDAVKNNLEYKTDNEIAKTNDPQTYQMAMVTLADKEGVAPFLSALNGSQLKNRIMMMKKKTKNRYAFLKQLVFLPLLAILVMGLSNKEIKTEIIHPRNQTKEVGTENKTEINVQLNTNKKSDQEDTSHRTGNLYNGTLRIRNSTGEMAKPLYIVNGKESLEDLPPGDMLPMSVLKDKSAENFYSERGRKRVIEIETTQMKSVPELIQGEKNNPDDFYMLTDRRDINSLAELQQKEKTELEKESDQKGIKIRKNKNQQDLRIKKAEGFNNDPNSLVNRWNKGNPLYIVDGKEMDNLDALDPKLIESITVLKDVSAIDLYGAKAKNGAVIICTNQAMKGTNEQLVIVDGKEYSYDQIEKISPDQIASIDVLKGKSATDFYGEKGKNGVIIIKTKGVDYKESIYFLDGKKVDQQEAFNHMNSRQMIKNIIRLDAEQAKEKYGPAGKNGVVEIYSKKNPTTIDKLFSTKSTEENPLVLVDGEKFGNIDQIDPVYIHSMNVLKDDAAKEKYGDIGKNGVIEITLKKPDELTQNEIPVVLNGKPYDKKLNEVNRNLIHKINKVEPDEAMKKYGDFGKLGVLEVNSRNVFTDKVKIQNSVENQQNEKPLIVTDGIITGYKSLEDIDPKAIESINVLKDKSATKKYGKLGENGVIEITLKPEKIDSVLKLRKFIANEIKYPVLAQKANREKTVQLFIKINRKGKITNIKEESSMNGINLDEVVVIGYKTEDAVTGYNSKAEAENARELEEQLLVNEVKRVINKIPEIDISNFKGETIGITVKFILQ